MRGFPARLRQCLPRRAEFLLQPIRKGNLAYRVQEGNTHDGSAAMQYIYNGLIWIWK